MCQVFFRRLCVRKPMLTLHIELGEVHGFRQTLNWYQLLAIGLGGTIGAGIFVLSGKAAAKYSGPSVIISFLIAGVIVLFSSLSFSELGAMMPSAGSVYTYTHVALGGMRSKVLL
ncbi:unnamed protein product [Rotaria sordida]|uniref:Amino acid permease/ SLC12A domain-containing protein n=1 Tax=Rotaria sordida TaxID=392033 RepID=A0A815ZSM0_9BILA|nr:unnamed protein product [Rotaria sordida]